MLSWIGAIVFFAAMVKGGSFGLDVNMCALVCAIFALAGDLFIGLSGIAGAIKSKRK